MIRTLPVHSSALDVGPEEVQEKESFTCRRWTHPRSHGLPHRGSIRLRLLFATAHAIELNQRNTAIFELGMVSTQPVGMIRSDVFSMEDDYRRAYETAAPYPYVAIDNFLSPEFAERVHDESRATAANQDASNGVTQSLKVACTDWNAFGPNTHRLISYLNSADFIDAVGRIVGIDNLFGDPELEGGGIHITRRGGFLKMHTDFNWHARLQADRRVNAILYLNKNWESDYGGALLLADIQQKNNALVEPLFNRLVIFNTNDATLHGHPDPLMFPDDYPRASIAMYYYSRGRPNNERLRGRATTTRYLPRDRRDIDLRNGSLKASLGYLVRRFFRI